MKKGEKQKWPSVFILHGALIEAACTPSSDRCTTKRLPGELYSDQVAIASNCVCEYLCFISVYFVHLLARYVIRYQKSLEEVFLGGLGTLNNFPI